MGCDDGDMVSIISSRTPEGSPNRCPICQTTLRIAPSSGTYDAPCPSCGALLWFLPTGDGTTVYDANVAAPVVDKVSQLFAGHLGISQDQLHPGTFTKDIGADSLDVVELVMALEEEFGVTISDSDFDEIKTVGDVIRYIIERMRDCE
jgi:acyl carrier protein